MKEKWELYSLSNRQLKILRVLYVFRGATALQVAKYLYNTRILTRSQEKYTYNQLAYLAERGFVNFNKSNNKRIKHSLYFLTSKGLSQIQSYYMIQEGFEGEGWVPDEKFEKQGYFQYEVHSPPLNQIEHHSMLIDFFINISIDRNEEFEYRNNLYSVRRYGNNQKLRMDAEVKYGERKLAIELDRGTERYAQLVEKFKNYRQYILNAEHKNDITDILIVVRDVENESKLRQRWETIVSAFLIAMDNFALKVDLHLCQISDVYNFMYRHFGFYHYKHKQISKGIENTNYQKVIETLTYDVLQFKNDMHLLVYFDTQYSTKIIRILDETRNLQKLYYLVGKTKDLKIEYQYNIKRYQIPIRFIELINKLKELSNPKLSIWVEMSYIGGINNIRNNQLNIRNDSIEVE